MPPLSVKVAFAGAASALAIAGIDYATGYESMFNMFYLAPVSLYAWHGSLRTGLGMALCVTVLWGVADRLSGHVYPAAMIACWNIVEQFVGYAAMAIVVHRLRQSTTPVESPPPKRNVEESAASARAMMRRIESDGGPRRPQ